MLGDVSPVVLGVHAPVDLEVITRGHLQPAHAPGVTSEVGHVIQAALTMGRERDEEDVRGTLYLVSHHYPPPRTHLRQLHQTENLRLILKQK